MKWENINLQFGNVLRKIREGRFGEQHENRAKPPPRAVGCYNQRVWAVRNSSADISTTLWYSPTV